MSDGSFRNDDIARRLVVLRQALGYNQTAFAALIGTTPSAVNNYESGFRRPSLEVARDIVLRTGATLDWLYLGNRGGLPAHLLARLPAISDPDQKSA
jgi:transcriptional regulator with XRE-family HTH domain